ncbi:hypothetical protein AURDEDRAFT_173732 [Auricularia subglabra TFB-10046 SS5]|uniref:Uncharacterized protein n=1 Tax=Auricularia subglabra (strain TFB-10046 / SS5) TaxID=717982 RepID=J0LH78_AURST|nr:hypothetical protein AURDEDRAFT_173732 [Auricularia subglabra TFB-10046 SS5]
MAKKLKRPRSKPSKTANSTIPPPTPLDPKWSDVRTAYAVASGLLWPQDPMAQAHATTAGATDAHIPPAQSGQAAPGECAADRPFAFGLGEQHASFEFTVPPGPGISAAPTLSTAEHTSIGPAGRVSGPGSSAQGVGPSQNGSDQEDWTSPLAWELFLTDLREAIWTEAKSFDEVWSRYIGPTAAEPSNTVLGPRAQENQNTLPRHIPTQEEVEAMWKFLFIKSRPPYIDVPVQPKSSVSQAVSLNNGQKTRQPTETHTVECERCTADGRPSWHAPGDGIKKHLETHTTPPKACVLCGRTISGRGDAGTTHRRNRLCAVYNELKARGDEMVACWAFIWGVRRHEQWGNGAHIRNPVIDSEHGR